MLIGISELPDGEQGLRYIEVTLADIALALRDEQLQARIVHYKADLETSPELVVMFVPSEGIYHAAHLLRRRANALVR